MSLRTEVVELSRIGDLGCRMSGSFLSIVEKSEDLNGRNRSRCQPLLVSESLVSCSPSKIVSNRNETVKEMGKRVLIVGRRLSWNVLEREKASLLSTGEA